MNVNLRHEIVARAFEIQTGHMAPSKDSPTAIGPSDACDLSVRQTAWSKWRSEFGEAIDAMIKAMDEIEDYSPEKERVTDQPFHQALELDKSANPGSWPTIHGYNCEKVSHKESSGYLHGENDDTPYGVDGCCYCGRCHVALAELA